jgi:hypothetical protein
MGDHQCGYITKLKPNLAKSSLWIDGQFGYTSQIWKKKNLAE